MKYILIFILFTFICFNYTFSAVIGGEINYRNISGFTYEINIIVCKMTTPYDSIEVYCGDGTSGIFGIIEEAVNSNFTICKYQGYHTYPGPGAYEIITSLIKWGDDYNNILISQMMKQMTIVVKDNASVETMNVNSGIKIYPNPASSSVTIVINDQEFRDLRISFIALTGETVYSENTKISSYAAEKTINISGIANGVYILKVETDKNVFRQKIVIQKL